MEGLEERSVPEDAEFHIEIPDSDLGELYAVLGDEVEFGHDVVAWAGSFQVPGHVEAEVAYPTQQSGEAWA